MNLFRYLLVLIFGLFFTSIASSQAATQSVIAWEVKSATNTIYLAGELHYYEPMYIKNLTNSLAEKIVKNSISIWTENTVEKQQVFTYNVKNSSRISEKTWREFQINLRSFFESDVLFIGKSVDERQQFANNLILEMNASHPAVVYASLAPWAIQFNWIRRNYKPKRIPGFILSQLAKSPSVKALEPPDTYADMWVQFCNNDTDAVEIFRTLNLIMSSALSDPLYPSLSNEEYFFNLQIMQNAENQGHMPYADSALLQRCNVIPRNKLWLPTILDALNDDKPAAFFVGIAHLIGDDGIIQMIKKSRPDVTIRRIYELPDK